MPADGAGSFAGMADDPVATAASNNPALSTLVQAVTAPTSWTASTVPRTSPCSPRPTRRSRRSRPTRCKALLADNAKLTAVLTHHVIAGRLSPEQLAGTHTTLNNDKVTIEGSGETSPSPPTGTSRGTEAAVICGNVQTANATVYIIDQVLAPAA